MDLKKNTPYRIDFKVTEKYLSILKSSGFFSDGYIQSQRDYFKKIDITLQKTKQNDGPIDGLDGDRIVWSQEPESILENLNDIKLMVASSKSNGITVDMHTAFDVDRYLAYDLKKVSGKFPIDKIYCVAKKITPPLKRQQ